LALRFRLPLRAQGWLRRSAAAPLAGVMVGLALIAPTEALAHARPPPATMSR
jgi:hypothetical protein